MGTLYILGTPIGNLEDITLRQLRIMQEVDFIAAEDTRVTRKLLSHYDIHTPLLSYHEHSDASVAQSIVERLQGGENGGIVTDAGMPCISDPGEPLIRLCREQGVPMEVVPGPSAAIAALALSGQRTARFTFEGFLSVTQNQRRRHLEELRDEPRTMIFYEAPHKLARTLADLRDTFGEERSISICHELTKVHEEVWVTTLGEAAARYAAETPKGEFVLVVAGAPPKPAGPSCDLDTAVAQVRDRVDAGEKLTAACKAVAEETGFSKRDLYAAIQNNT